MIHTLDLCEFVRSGLCELQVADSVVDKPGFSLTSAPRCRLTDLPTDTKGSVPALQDSFSLPILIRAAHPEMRDLDRFRQLPRSRGFCKLNPSARLPSAGFHAIHFPRPNERETRSPRRKLASPASEPYRVSARGKRGLKPTRKKKMLSPQKPKYA